MDGSAVNASGRVVATDVAPEPSADPAVRAKRGLLRRLFARKELGELRVYQHSNLIYWWPVWAYGYFCAGYTYFDGIAVKQLAATEEKAILFHKAPWLGVSFLALVLFVIIFTNVRARGVYSFVLLLVSAALVYGASRIPGIGVAMNWAALLRVHLNLGFYLAFSSALTLVWLFVVVFVDHFTWWRFSPGQVIEEHRIGQATGHAYNTEGMVVRRLPDDLFRHRILGLGFTGGGRGMGDFIVKPPNDESFEIINVWRANGKQRRMEDMIATRMTEATKAKT
jgi:hypothetical protein